MLTFISTLTLILTFTTSDFVVYCFVNGNISVRMSYPATLYYM